MAQKTSFQQLVERPDNVCTCSNTPHPGDAAKKLRSKLLDFDEWPYIDEYEYDKLPSDRQRIRLLRLLPGVLENPQIDCEIFEGEFDKDGDLLEIGTIEEIERNEKVERNKQEIAAQRKKRENAARREMDQVRSNGEKDTQSNVQEEDQESNKEAEKDNQKTEKNHENLEKEEEEVENEDREAKEDKGEDEDDEDDGREDHGKVLTSPQKPGLIRYEALSWRWGNEDKGLFTIMIKKEGKLFKKRVSQTLGLALKYLRLNEDRILWIDAICINQRDLEERSYQVSMMSLVYTGSKEVCVWLGDDDDDSTIAIQFIKDEISQLKNFDRLSTDKEHAKKWRALLALMQRDW
jgi:hypothetical protein